MTLLTRTTSLTGFYELITRLNGNPDALLERFNIDPGKVKTLDGVLPYRTKINLVEEAARQLNCPDFGLRLAQEQDLLMLGPVAAIALNAPTVGDALENIIQYLHYHTPGIRTALDRERSADLAYLKFDLNHRLANHRQNLEQVAGFANNTLKVLYGSDFRAKSILMRADSPLPHGRYEHYFEAPVHFGSECDALVLTTAQLHRKIDQANPLLHSLLDQYISDAMLDNPLEVKQQVEQLIHRLLPIQRCNLQTVASQLGLHKRTLQRRLAERGVIFEEFLDTIRRQRAEKYLAEAEMPMTQIAALIGYREQSSFNRACRRWFGTTPLNVRRELLTKALEREETESGEMERT